MMKKLELEGEQALKELSDEYENFLVNNSVNLEKTFYEKNDFHTSVRGIKIRGTFDSKEKHKYELRYYKIRPSHNVFARSSRLLVA